MKEGNKSPAKIVYSIFMVIFYLTIAVLLVLTPIFDNVNIIMRIIMGVLFFLYGLFRGYRVWKGL